VCSLYESIEQTELSGAVVLTPRLFEDDRGGFSETYNARTLAAAGISETFVQDNQSLSRKAGTVRGLHFQSPPHAQAKLVRVVSGSALDVAVDIRVGSPTYGKAVLVELSAVNRRQLFVPVGFLHGFVTLVPDTEVVYKCTDFYSPECDRSVRFDDPDLNIDWGITREAAILSDKDSRAPFLKDIQNPFTWGTTE
jgi:dTDP-4-dehydrorhamnose 3,5-epimerase